MSDVAKVRSVMQAPLALRLFDEVKDEMGNKRFRERPLAATFTLQPGDNDIDAAFFKEWLAQNAESQIVKEGLVQLWQPPQQ